MYAKSVSRNRTTPFFGSAGGTRGGAGGESSRQLMAVTILAADVTMNGTNPWRVGGLKKGCHVWRMGAQLSAVEGAGSAYVKGWSRNAA